MKNLGRFSRKVFEKHEFFKRKNTSFLNEKTVNSVRQKTDSRCQLDALRAAIYDKMKNSCATCRTKRHEQVVQLYEKTCLVGFVVSL